MSEEEVVGLAELAVFQCPPHTPLPSHYHPSLFQRPVSCDLSQQHIDNLKNDISPVSLVLKFLI